MKNSDFGSCVQAALKISAVVLTAIALLSGLAKAEVYVIAGYGPSETAVKGDQERQALEMVKAWGEKKPVKIIVHGFADKTGKTAENDSIAKERAKEMEAFLAERMDARIISRSKGESEDARKVVVAVEFAAAAAPPAVRPMPQVEEKGRLLASYIESSILVLAGVGVILFVAVLFVIWRVKQKLPPTVIQIEHGGKAYLFSPEVDEKGRFLTLHKIKGLSKFLAVKTPEDLRKSLHSSFKQEPGLVERLIEQGRLRLA